MVLTGISDLSRRFITAKTQADPRAKPVGQYKRACDGSIRHGSLQPLPVEKLEAALLAGRQTAGCTKTSLRRILPFGVVRMGLDGHCNCLEALAYQPGVTFHNAFGRFQMTPSGRPGIDLAFWLGRYVDYRV